MGNDEPGVLLALRAGNTLTLENHLQQKVCIKTGTMAAGFGRIAWTELKGEEKHKEDVDIMFQPAGSDDMVLLQGSGSTTSYMSLGDAVAMQRNNNRK